MNLFTIFEPLIRMLTDALNFINGLPAVAKGIIAAIAVHKVANVYLFSQYTFTFIAPFYPFEETFISAGIRSVCLRDSKVTQNEDNQPTQVDARIVFPLHIEFRLLRLRWRLEVLWVRM